VGSQPLPRWARGPLSVSCRLGTPTYKFQVKTRSGRGLTRHHVPCSAGPCLLAEVGSEAVMCPVALDAASLIGRAPAPPRVPWLRTPPPCKGGLRCTTCPTTPDPSSLEGRALERRVSNGSGSCLPAGRVAVPPPHAQRFPMDRGPQA
jgi:hypothetical protein